MPEPSESPTRIALETRIGDVLRGAAHVCTDPDCLCTPETTIYATETRATGEVIPVPVMIEGPVEAIAGVLSYALDAPDTSPVDFEARLYVLKILANHPPLNASELSRAAAIYAQPGASRELERLVQVETGEWYHDTPALRKFGLPIPADVLSRMVPERWPFGVSYWQPTPEDRGAELAKAQALLAAEAGWLKARGQVPNFPPVLDNEGLPPGFVPAFTYIRTEDGTAEYVHSAGEALLAAGFGPAEIRDWAVYEFDRRAVIGRLVAGGDLTEEDARGQAAEYNQSATPGTRYEARHVDDDGPAAADQGGQL
jgi:hypothetical protein